METIDVSGQQCPDPLKIVASALANAPAGARYKIVTD
ncbi:MAG: sulfurtransferase TusA family protein, partial [Pyrobaculum sp.]